MGCRTASERTSGVEAIVNVWGKGVEAVGGFITEGRKKRGADQIHESDT